MSHKLSHDTAGPKAIADHTHWDTNTPGVGDEQISFADMIAML